MTSYEGMARDLDIPYCRGILPTGHYCQQTHHLNGSINPSDGTIHFSERPVTRANTLAFLRLVARAIDHSLDADPEVWRRAYLLNIRVRALAKTLHIKDPGHPARLDRVFVLSAVAGMSNEVPMRKQAHDWARRGPKRKKEE